MNSGGFVRLHAILACHNRRDLTVRAILELAAAGDRAGVRVEVVLYDDGSTDGTAHAVRSLDLPVQILSGSGAAFWARGMARAERAVLEQAHPEDAILWLNDDVRLDEDALARLLKVSAERPQAVVVGAMRDPDTGEPTYGGLERRGRHPMSYGLVAPRDVPVEVDTSNGNCVLVPVQVARAVGGIDGQFPHALADIDYGLRSRAAGHPVVLAPGTVGECPRNPPRPRSSLREEWRAFTAIKGGGHPPTMHRFLRKVTPRTWPLFMLATYILWWVRAVRGKLTPQAV
ncbi:glycosyltransferase family 2 protein [Georgenia sp. 10Sc9-8]|uniref:Glycosyltransferase family 2 protein n=1 Tax=Georgenia halotolerans TaxID=3028317 RepID=A0ABT5TXL2_9MICO|nr:glycosyltransferase family 2 protein [Georgenia halotolerans]